ncbi:hypothetical protein [Bacillus sp. SA1-12]|uniref:right-handed parallel beta-helix repeat-containing protein n=1 Tax=Bacillus sp. SA1-12 TaxID=1455638 RepID=UPI000AFC93B9|nr:hypothetical protein [Bacillus sp. SA1-12]
MPVHTVRYSLAVNNGANGFYANHQPGKSANWINNTAYNNGISYGANFNMLERVSPTSEENIPGYREVLHNNIAYKGISIINENHPQENVTNNSWTIDGGLEIKPEYFYSLDVTQLSAPRKTDGSLPDVTFMRPVPTSPLYKYELGYLADQKDPILSLQELVKSFTEEGTIDNHGIANSLQKKLKNHNLSAFIHQVEAQSGKHIDKETANILLRDVNAFNALITK